MDVLDDVACLAMDLERLGVAERAAEFLRDYAEFSGAHYPDSLAHHYIAYRAVMRAKVAAIQGRQQTPRLFAGLGDATRRLVDLGVGHLERGRVRLILVGGGPATGKSTLAGALSDHAGLVVLSSDRVRKEMLGLDPVGHYPAAPGQGIYSPSVTDHTYRQLADQSERLLAMGESVVVDASFTAARHRDLIRRVAHATHSSVTELRCEAPEDVVRQRLRRRETQADRYSDAGEAVAAVLRNEADPWPEAYVVDTTEESSVCVRRAEAAAGLRASADLS
jgi:predicted kinase